MCWLQFVEEDEAPSIFLNASKNSCKKGHLFIKRFVPFSDL